MRKPRPARRPRRSPGRARPRTLPGGIAIVHEDDDLIVVDKPPGLNTVAPPGQAAAPNLFAAVKDHVRSRVRRRGARVWIIHRLDKEASGLLVFARSERAFRRLKDDLLARRLHRQYLAVVEGAFDRARDGGAPGEAAGTIRSYLYEDRAGLVHSVGSPAEAPPPRARRGDEEDAGEARPAVTHYRVLRCGHGRSLVQVRLETGRKNQIRVHMAAAGHPVAGDRRYGAATDPAGRLCLHAAALGFEHPVTGRSMLFRSEAPAAFRSLVGARDDEGHDEEGHDEEDRQIEPGTLSSGAAAPESWDHVAAWYDRLLEERTSDHHERVIYPGALRLLDPRPGDRVLDIACGQGHFCRRLKALGAAPTGVDASPRLIAAAQAADPAGRYLAGDARELGALGLSPGFDAVTCIMALMNIDPIEPLLAGAAALLREGGRFVAVLLHPAFRAPGQTSWQWEAGAAGRGTDRQYRRVDAYLSPARREIVMNPGAVAGGAEPMITTTHLRPIGAYVGAFAGAGLLVDALEEWPSLRTSEPGPRAEEENRARREIPMFLALRGIAEKVSG